MIAFDLQCGAAHVFEVWFRSSADYADQRERRLIACPLCGDTGVTKAVMAPNVAAKGNQRRSDPPALPLPGAAAPATDSVPMAMGGPALPPQVQAMLAAVAAAQAEALPRSRWVGRAFAEQARAMHDGAVEPALIHGQATRNEAEALIDDGIGVMPLLVPVVPPDLQN